MTTSGYILGMRFKSAYEMLDLVQVACDHLTRLGGLDEDGSHWVGVAVRESVINAIKHGNRHDVAKDVSVEFALVPNGQPVELVVVVSDEGEGFEAGEVADPLAPENILRSSGRGIFFMRSFMDSVELQRRPEGGMQVCMRKRLPSVPAAFARPA